MKKVRLRYKEFIFLFLSALAIVAISFGGYAYYEKISKSDTKIAYKVEKNDIAKEKSSFILIEEPVEKIVFDGLTVDKLTEKLNRNLYSTLAGTGRYFAEYTEQTGLDPYLAVSIVLLETGCKWGCSRLVTSCYNIGGVQGSPSCGGGAYKKYDSLEEGIYGFLNLVYYGYYSKGLNTPELMNTKYASSKTWAQKVNNYITQIKNN